MKQKQPTIRDALYEAPGPKARKRIAVATVALHFSPRRSRDRSHPSFCR